MAIRAITFDFWRTLFRDQGAPERWRLRASAAARITGAEEDAVLKALEAVNPIFQQHHIEHQETLTPLHAVRIVGDKLGVKLEQSQTEELVEVFATAIIHHSPVPIDNALDAVREAAGLVPVGIVSDSGMSPGSSLRVLLDRHGFTPYLGAMVFSDELGVSKPQAAMFKTAAQQLAVEPSELLHIGDLEYTDVEGALGVQAKAALFAEDNPRHLGATRAAYTFTSWTEFLEMLPRLVE